MIHGHLNPLQFPTTLTDVIRVPGLFDGEHIFRIKRQGNFCRLTRANPDRV